MVTPLRADAERNRCQLVNAALSVFAERGLDAPLDEIARRAGVGNATLYRRFPTRCDLVAAVFLSAMQEIVAAAAQALAEPDPWTAFTGHLTYLCEVQAANRALGDLLTSTVSGMPELERLRARALAALTELIDRAKAHGDLREDFSHEDVVLILMANAGLIERTAGPAPGAARRYLSYVLDGLRATGR
jgi:AcrR family transcriptional regulator